MHGRTRCAVVTMAIGGLFFTAAGVVSHDEAQATAAFNVQEANPTITITNEGATYRYSPDATAAKAGQPITIINKDPNGVHAVTAKDGSFSVDIPPNASTTLTVKKPGSYPYYCTYHTDAHNPASISVS